MNFYGTSFIADKTGEIIKQANRIDEDVLVVEFDLYAIREKRYSWGVYRYRRPERYGLLEQWRKGCWRNGERLLRNGDRVAGVTGIGNC